MGDSDKTGKPEDAHRRTGEPNADDTEGQVMLGRSPEAAAKRDDGTTDMRTRTGVGPGEGDDSAGGPDGQAQRH